VGKIIYTAEAQVTGGRANGRGRTAGGELDIELRFPKELGGAGDGLNPEQLFAVGYAACFESTMALVAPRLQLSAEDASIDSKVMLITREDAGYQLGVKLEITLPSVADPGQAAALVRTAHQICPYSNATRGNIDVEFVVNGTPLEG